MLRISISSNYWVICLVALFLSFGAQGQEELSRWSFSAGYGQYGARLALPDFSAFHPGGEVGIHYQLNKHTRHQLFQSGTIGFFAHPDLQSALQLYTEIRYQWVFADRWSFSPLGIGGGYVASFGQLEGYRFNPSTQQYEPETSNLRHNWIIGLGSKVSYHSSLQLLNRPITLGLHYRLQVQGVFVQETVPVIAYTPILFSISLPLR